MTGASRGIGRAVARRLSRNGAEVHLLARSADELQLLAAELGGRAWPADLTDDAEVWNVIELLRESLGGAPDIVVNAGGVFSVAPIHETSVAAFDECIATNLRGTFLVLRCLLPDFLARGRGTIVNVGSVAGREAFPNNGAYSASKFGLRGLHEVLVEELRGTGVRATLLEPGATNTGLWDPLDPDSNPQLPDRETMLRPEDVADAVVFVATRSEGVQIPFLPLGTG